MDPAALERERAILTEQAKSEGKPEEIAQKMVEGRLRKYYEDVCLLEQNYVIDTDQKVNQVVDNFAKEIAAKVTLTAFAIYKLGEGLEKKARRLCRRSYCGCARISTIAINLICTFTFMGNCRSWPIIVFC